MNTKDIMNELEQKEYFGLAYKNPTDPGYLNPIPSTATGIICIKANKFCISTYSQNSKINSNLQSDFPEYTPLYFNKI